MGRPIKPLIEVKLVVEAALQLIEEVGLEGLNMRELGKRIGVNPASLYHHFKNKEEILNTVRTHLVRKVKLPANIGTKTWEEQITITGKAYRAALTHHPNGAWLVAANNPIRSRVLAHGYYEGLISSLLAAGFSKQQSSFILVGVETLVIGSILEELTMGRRLDFGEVDADNFPNIARLASGKPLAVKRVFHEMLAIFIAGVKTLLPVAATPKPNMADSPEAIDVARRRLRSVRA